MPVQIVVEQMELLTDGLSSGRGQGCKDRLVSELEQAPLSCKKVLISPQLEKFWQSRF